MPYGIQLVTGPAAEPVTLAQAKLHLAQYATDDDALIAVLIQAAREMVEHYLGRSLISQTWCLTLDQFPNPVSLNTLAPYDRDGWLGPALYFSWNGINIPRSKVTSIVSITYLDDDQTLQTLDPSLYSVDLNSESARIVPSHGGSWPYPNSFVPGSIAVTFTTGEWTATTVPASIQQAMLLLIGNWYANREAIGSTGLGNLPLAFDALLARYKLYV